MFRFADLDRSPKSSPLICEYLAGMKGSAPADDHRWTVLVFRDRMGLEQQVDQLVSPAREEPTAEPTPCENNKIFLPFKCSLQDSPCIALFLVGPTGNHSLFLLPPFLPLLLFSSD